ncbi:MAG: hypothetical protein MK033_12435 [Candidatus Caenarcaniphilales bacterium]|nr:hypothetical protein [Candidatus Caenarcaniphilales bacterium]
MNIKDSMKNKEIPLALNLEEENLWNKWLDLDFEKIKILNIDYAKKFENMMTEGNRIRFFPSFISDVKDIKKIHESFEALDITADVNIDAFWNALKNHSLVYKGDVKLQLDMVLEAQQNVRDIDISPIANHESFEAMMKRYSFSSDSFWAMIAEKK